ncbi:MAG TPA: TrmH family RNA methyltransferase [Bacteroidales bacterium]
MKKLTTEELNRIGTEEYKNAEKKPVLIVLDNIRSLNNIGSIFRTADAFRIEGIYLCGITACPPHREIQKTALGATDSVDWKYFEKIEDAIADLKQNSYKILAAEQTDKSTKLNFFIPEKEEKYALVFGNEINGVSPFVVEFADFCIEIPQYGTKHSFNVTVSAGIILWDMLFKMNLLT